MCIKTFVVPLVAGTIFLCACKRDAVNLDYTNAKGEVPRLGNLVFRFNKSLVSDSVLNLWDSTEFISFEPEIPGRFRWESPDQLVFSPLQPLAGATTYKAKFNRELLRHSKYDKVEKADKMNFHTPDLSLDQSQVIWMLKDETSRAPVSQIDMYFNYRVNPDDLKDKLTIEVEGKKVSYSLHTLSAGNKISVRLMNLKAEDKDLEARVIIDKGLKPEQGNNKTIEPIMASISIPSPFVLSIQNVEAEHDGTEGTVRVMTSQQVSSENLKSFLKFNPGLNYNIQHDETGFIISSDKFDITQSYVLTILKGLRGNIGGTLKEDMTNSVAFGELEANINFTNNKAVYLSKHGGKNTEVRITNVPKVRMIISKIYESNLLMAQRYGYYPKESNEARYTSYEGDYEGDYYEERANEVMLGDVIYEKEIDTRSLPRSAGGRLLDFRQFEDRLPDFKGIYHVMIRSTKDYWVRDISGYFPFTVPDDH